MTAVIRLDHVLREAVARPYRDLVTRPTGRAVRNGVLTALRDSAFDDAQLDFSAVGLVDFSCADEVVARLLAEPDALPVRQLVLRGLRADHIEAIGHALRCHGLVAIALFDDGSALLLGLATADSQMAVAALARLGRVAASSLAEALAWTLPRAEAALDGLVRCRCLRLHDDNTFDLGAVA